MEQRANLIVSSWLAELRMQGLGQGMELSDFSIMTDYNNDIRQIGMEQGASERDMDNYLTQQKALGITTDAVTINGKTYINTASNTTFGMNLTASGFNSSGITLTTNQGEEITQSDAAKAGGTLLSHERKHQKGEASETKAYTEQIRILDKFGPTFSSPGVYNYFRERSQSAKSEALREEKIFR